MKPPVPISSNNNPPKKYLSRNEAAKYLCCSIRKLDALKHDGRIAFHKLGSRIVFNITDLDAWMEEQRIAVQ